MAKRDETLLRREIERTMAETIQHIRDLPPNDPYKPILQSLVDDLIETMVKLAQNPPSTTASP